MCRLPRRVVRLRHHGHEPTWLRVRAVAQWPQQVAGGRGPKSGSRGLAVLAHGRGKSSRLHWRSSCVSRRLLPPGVVLVTSVGPASARTPLGAFWGSLGSMVGCGLAPQLWSAFAPKMPPTFPLSPGGRLQRALRASLVLSEVAMDVFQGHVSLLCTCWSQRWGWGRGLHVTARPTAKSWLACPYGFIA